MVLIPRQQCQGCLLAAQVALAAVLVLPLAVVALHLEPPSISFLSWMLMTLLTLELPALRKLVLEEPGLEEPVLGQRDVHCI